MSKGKWYFVYTFVNTMEAGMRSSGIEDCKTLLKAENEKDALVEGQAIWEDVVKKANAYWEEQKKTWVSPPADAFNGISPNPRIIYKSNLQLIANS